MSALSPILSKLATSKIEVVGDTTQAKNLESLFLERGFIALLGATQHGTKSCGSCATGSSCNCGWGVCFVCDFCCV